MKRICKTLLILVLFVKTAYCVVSKSPMDEIKSNNVNERMDGFYGLVYTGGNITNPNCKFKVSDSASAKKAVIDLLRKERKYESDNLTNRMYPPKLGEGFGEYIADIGIFVDSCEDESAVDMFPGPRTLKKYPQQSTEIILSRLENREKSGNYTRNVRHLGIVAPYYKETNKKLYDRVKIKLIELVDDENLSERAVYSLSALGDVDLIPVFEKIAKYDDSKGTVRIYNGKKRIDPVSGIAKEVLEKLQRKVKAKSPQLPPGATQGINVQ